MGKTVQVNDRTQYDDQDHAQDSEVTNFDGVNPEVEDDEAEDLTDHGDPDPDGDAGEDGETIEVSASMPAATADNPTAKLPRTPRPEGPTLQQIALAKSYEGVEVDPVHGVASLPNEVKDQSIFLRKDLHLHQIRTVVQIGVPTATTSIVDVPKAEKVKDPISGLESVVKSVEKKEVISVEYAWGEKEVYGDPYNALTPALRTQAIVAKQHRTSDPNAPLEVSEDTKKEYGVWYAKDPTGKHPGYRYSLEIGDLKPVAPPKPPKEPKAPRPPKEPKAAKVPKTQELDADGNPVPTAPKAAKQPRQKKANNDVGTNALDGTQTDAQALAAQASITSADDIEVSE